MRRRFPGANDCRTHPYLLAPCGLVCQTRSPKLEVVAPPPDPDTALIWRPRRKGTRPRLGRCAPIALQALVDERGWCTTLRGWAAPSKRGRGPTHGERAER